MHLYLATDLRAGRRRPAPARRGRAPARSSGCPGGTPLAAAERGEFRDGKTLVGLLWLARLREGRLAASAVRRPARASAARSRAAPARRGRGACPGLSATASRRCVAASAPAPEPLQALAERVMAEVRRRIDLEQRLERRRAPARPGRSCSTPARAPRGSSPCRARADPRARGRSRPGRDAARSSSAWPRWRRSYAVSGSVVSAGSGRADSIARWWHGSRGCHRTRSSGLPLAVGRQVDRLQARRIGEPGDPAALGDRLAVDLLDVAGEVDRGGAADVRPDGVRVDRRAGLLEVADPVRA